MAARTIGRHHDLVEVAAHDLPEGFRVELLAQFGGPGNVAEEDGDRLASFLAGRDPDAFECGAAFRAELGPIRIVRAGSRDRRP
jgi:hypothetical protein